MFWKGCIVLTLRLAQVWCDFENNFAKLIKNKIFLIEMNFP
jgi:hypothetical protein